MFLPFSPMQGEPALGCAARRVNMSSGQDQDDVILLPISTAKRKVIGIKQANADAVDVIMR
jgi:hypothetical protein